MIGLLLLIVAVGYTSAALNFFLLTYLGQGTWIIVCVDILLLVHMLVHRDKEYAATNGATQWLVWSWSTLVKLLLYYFVVFAAMGEVTDEGRSVDELAGDWRFNLAIFLVPAQYSIWMLRAAYQLFGSPSKTLSVQSFLHFDIVFHVVLDLIDLAIAFSFGFDRYLLRTQDAFLIPLVNAIFMGVGWFMHSYAFPTGSINLPPFDQASVRTESDIFLTRKHVALVSIMLIDIPQLALRIYVWCLYPLRPGLQAFVFKNAVSIPLSIFRLNQCRMAEKQHQGQVMLAVLPDGQPWTPGVPNIATVADGTNWSEGPEPPFTGTRATKESRSLFRDRSNKTPGYSTSLVETEQGSIYLPDQPPPEQLQEIVDLIEGVRSVPVRGFPVLSLLRKFHHALVHGAACSVPSRVQEVEPQSWWTNVRLCMPICLHVAWYLILIEAHVAPFDLILVEDGRSWESTYIGIFLGSIIGYGLLHAVIWIGLVPWLDIFWVLLWMSVRGGMIWTLIRAFSASGFWDFRYGVLNGSNGAFPPSGDNSARGDNATDGPAKYLVYVVAVPVVWRFLWFSTYLMMALANRRYARYIIPEPDQSLPPELICASGLVGGVGPQPVKLPLDEQGFVSLSSVLTVFNCYYHFAPCTVHGLLMGPDLVKSIRLCDVMLQRDWMKLILVSGTIGFMFLLEPNEWGAIYGGVYILLALVYLVVAQAVRLLYLRKHEVQELLIDLLNQWDTLPDSSVEQICQLADPLSDQLVTRERLEALGVVNRDHKQPPFITLTDQVENIKFQGLFTSGGPILPPNL